MLYAVISDIHANLPALEAVLHECEELGVDRFLCLGDIVGYGAFPNECCQIIRELDADIVRGNHDEAAVRPGKELWFTTPARLCILWTREVLEEENRRFLATLKPFRVREQYTICHGSLADPDYYTTSPYEAAVSFRLMETPIGFLGHTHVAEYYRWRQDMEPLPRQTLCPDGCRIQLGEGKYLINPGAVGQPRDGNSLASFAVWNVEERWVEIRRVPYNVRAAQEAILKAGLPEAMAMRLSYGV